MNYTVFYSWQSDLESRFNRSFIEEILENAVKNISNNEGYNLEAVVDRDTYGIPGSPSIVESITGKIAKSDVFVCDISIINSKSNGRNMPNPNVLFELGFASAILGWDRIILIQNVAFGGIEKLPFDLRGRRILQYNLDDTVDNKADEKQKLKLKLTKTFENALKHYSIDILGTKEKVIWWGKWNVESKVKARGAQLCINRVSSDAFFFDIRLFDGARTGEVHGKAHILTPHSAYARIKSIEDNDCEVLFKRRLEGNSWYIEIEAGQSCSHFHGMGATFSGAYKHETEPIVNYGYLDEIDLNEIERLIGNYFPVFLDNFQQYGSHVDEQDLTVITGGVKGLYTIMESIIVLDKKGGVWCAYLDPEKNVVRYFTNASSKIDIRPEAMKEWLLRFSDKKIIINDKDSKERIGIMPHNLMTGIYQNSRSLSLKNKYRLVIKNEL
jgi:hypothetical protein